MKKLNNSGFSLIELIVAVLIMAIIAGGATAAISSVTDMDADRAAKRIAAAFKVARTKALAASDDISEVNPKSYFYVAIFREGDEIKVGAYKHIWDIHVEGSSAEVNRATDIEVFDAVPLGSYRLGVRITGQNGGGDIENFDDDGDMVVFAFRRITGCINPAYTTVGENGKDYTDIYLNGTKNKKLIIVKATGRIYED